MDPWHVLDIYFRDHTYPFTQHHIDSFREFLRNHIPNVIATYNPITMIKEETKGNSKINMSVEVYVGGKSEDGLKLYIDRPIMMDEDGNEQLLTPHEARIRNLTYQTTVYADIEVDYKTSEKKKPDQTETVKFERVPIGSIPIMLHSDPCILHEQGNAVLQGLGECMYDQGGYFIIDGKEKVIVSQERLTTNRLFTSYVKDPESDYSHRGTISCTAESGENALLSRTVIFEKVRQPDSTNPNPISKERAPHANAIYVTIPSMKGSFPLGRLFRALGVESDRAIMEHILGDVENAPPQFIDFLLPTLRAGALADTEKGDDEQRIIYTQKEAHEELAKRTFYDSVEQVQIILSSEVFPNITSENGSYGAKAKYLGYLVHEFMKFCLGVTPPSDRDGYVFKRVNISGFLLAQVFQEAYNNLRKHCRNILDQEFYYGAWRTGDTNKIQNIVRKDNLHKLIPPFQLTEAFVKYLKGTTADPNDAEGVVQDLSRISYISYLSHVRRVNLPFDRSVKIADPHRLHSQQWGVICPFESPDGASIGFLKNFALLTQITFGTNPQHIRDVLEDLEMKTEKDNNKVEKVVNKLTHLPSKYAMISIADGMTRVFVNGDWYGMTNMPHKVANVLRLLRRNGLINPFVSVAWNIQQNELRIQTESGRPCRPLFIMEKGVPTITKKYSLDKPLDPNGKVKWYELVFGTFLEKKERTQELYYRNQSTSIHDHEGLRNLDIDELCNKLKETQGVIEYMDIEEANTMLLAMDPATVQSHPHLAPYYTHMEIHPSTVFSVVTNNIPLANHNFAPRNTFFGSQSKQAIGVYATNFSRRFDTMSYIQHYPQRPLITSRNAHYTANDRMPNGFNAIVAVATYTGYNQEDGIIINRNAIDRGLFHITAYKTMSATEKVTSEQDQLIIANPIKLRSEGKMVGNIKYAKYKLLDEDGIVKEGAYIPKGQEAAVLGMVKVTKRLVTKKIGVLTEQVVDTQYRDVSLVTDVHHYGRIDKVMVASKGLGDAQRIAKIRFRKIRRPELGDKACSRCAQKGVIGMILPAESMPFTKSGIIPDIIINPHAFPSRMTISHIVECVFSKLCCMEGTLGDGTVFLPLDLDGMFDKLGTTGFEKHGNEIMYDGRTGAMINTEIFIGPTFYMRLKHMVADKIHGRGMGKRAGEPRDGAPMDQLTRQPTSGRSKDGGMRVGEMEKDVVLAHGMSQYLKESFMEKADKYMWAVCKHCGVLGKYTSLENGSFECMGCGNNEMSIIETPYAFKLLNQEMEGMGLQMRLSSDPFNIEDDMESEIESDDEAELSAIAEEDEQPETPMTEPETEQKDTGMQGGTNFYGNPFPQENKLSEDCNNSKVFQPPIAGVVETSSTAGLEDPIEPVMLQTSDCNMIQSGGESSQLLQAPLESVENPPSPVLASPPPSLTPSPVLVSPQPSPTPSPSPSIPDFAHPLVDPAQPLNTVGQLSQPPIATPPPANDSEIKVIDLGSIKNTSRAISSPQETNNIDEDDYDYDGENGDDEFFTSI